MVFVEPAFLFFFLPVLVAVYFASPAQYKNICLLIFSIVFYTWGEEIFVLVLVVMILLNFYIGLKIASANNLSSRKLYLSLGVISNLGVLVFFKYAYFIASNVTDSSLVLEYTSSIHLPIGISFFTFQALTYLIDLYRNQIAVQKSLINLALYISLFPQLVAGPIVRYSEIDRDLMHRVTCKNDFAQGIERFIHGLAKKILVADPLGLVADQVFAIPADGLSTPVAWFGITCYAMQIFFDFSAYSDMAIGLGRVFGFRFPENFNYPYISRSVTEFWRRWHMTLSRWFRDYLYIPLGGARAGNFRTYFNLSLVFLICGLWHGASWNFLLWGAYYGVFLIVERIGLRSLIERLPVALQHSYLILVVWIGWVPFRSDSLDQTLNFLSCMFFYQNGSLSAFYSLSRFADNYVIFTLAIAFLLSMPLNKFFSSLQLRQGNDLECGDTNVASSLKIFSLVCLFGLSIIAAGASSYSPFIYFRF